MADLTQETTIGADWVEISAAAALNMASGSTYRLEVAEAPSGARLRLAETDTATPPTVAGGPWFGPSRRRGADRIAYTRPSGARLWCRVEAASAESRAVIAATPTA